MAWDSPHVTFVWVFVRVSIGRTVLCPHTLDFQNNLNIVNFLRSMLCRLFGYSEIITLGVLWWSSYHAEIARWNTRKTIPRLSSRSYLGQALS